MSIETSIPQNLNLPTLLSHPELISLLLAQPASALDGLPVVYDIWHSLADGSHLSAEVQYNLKVLGSALAPVKTDPVNNWRLVNDERARGWNYFTRVANGLLPFHHFGIRPVNQQQLLDLSAQVQAAGFPGFATRIFKDALKYDPENEFALYNEMHNQETAITDLVFEIMDQIRTQSENNMRMFDAGFGSGFVAWQQTGIVHQDWGKDFPNKHVAKAVDYTGVAISEYQCLIAQAVAEYYGKSESLKFIRADMNDIKVLPEIENLDCFLQFETCMYVKPHLLTKFLTYAYNGLREEGYYLGVPWLKQSDNQYARVIDGHYSSSMHEVIKYREALLDAGFSEDNIHMIDLTQIAINYWQIRKQLGQLQLGRKGMTAGMGLDVVEASFINMYSQGRGGYYLVLAKK